MSTSVNIAFARIFLQEPPPGFKESANKKPHPKQKFVPLMSAEGQSCVTTRLPGRHWCQCLAQKHDLVNNCVKCGRIVCSQVRT